MPYILNIETATRVCSVALGNNKKVIASRDNVEQVKSGEKKYSHAELLSVFIDEVLQEAGIQYSDLKAVAISEGPGSYTGLRIGTSSAKGFCYALDIPLIAIGTLKAMANQIRETRHVSLLRERFPDLLLCPMIDARRMEVYSAFYDLGLNEYREVQADIIDESTYAEILQERPVIFFGDGMEKCKPVLSKLAGTYFIDEIFPSTKNMMELAHKAYKAREFVDVAYFEPFYLKEFRATVPKKLV